MGEESHYRRTGLRSGQRGTPRANARTSSWRGAITPLTIVLPLGLFAVLFPWKAVMGEAASDNASAPVPVSAQFALCVGGSRHTCVVDGDTIWLHGEKIRIADIDAPEISQPSCEAERIAGTRATERLTRWLNEGAFEVHPNPDGRDTDRYGRKLRVLARSGESAVETLEAEGLAARWGGRGRVWC
ncbi:MULTISPECIES: thermonuclease family protein [Citromicrobium]|uniref:thermonuclease family protein n=1 Tax=Citromicrobium TaxID=72173 RepID=UPI0001DD07F9|nr:MULTISPECIES: thermonuclease family protein [Citromicrobium]ALG59456.1 nuclease [Citromicrobium sp. JL477]KPM16114.1 nuclease [Citromicrobium sp. JL1351]KPM19424.1 nuclease [Citromicrobium sp. JL31]KPM23754.1 nuclease [Citromicrobium sp. JL2201]